MRMSDWSSDVCSSDLFALAAADGDEGVQSLETGLDGFVHRGARDDARRLHFDPHALLGLARTLAVDRIAEDIDDAAEHALPDGDLVDLAGRLKGLAFSSEEEPSELQSLMRNSSSVFCVEKTTLHS